MKIAIIGAGISGIGASLALGQAHDVHLFEADERIGGHAHTVELQDAGKSIPMDVGFLVFNELNYPQLTAMFRYLGVETVDSDMSLSIQAESGMEWNGTNINGVFGQRKNLFKPRFYAMIFEILRFHREAKANLALSRRHGWTLLELLQERRFTKNFSQNYLLPMGAAIWSTPEAKMLEYPADTFLQFFINHKLLQVAGRPQWKTVKGGSREYVAKAKTRIKNIHTNRAVTAVESFDNAVMVSTRDGNTSFDKVIFATHAPTVFALLKNPTAETSEILSSFQVEKNESVLHKDETLMPKHKRCWASWNGVSSQRGKAMLTYFLNRLQPLGTENEYFLSLNPNRKIMGGLAKFQYNHPQFDRKAIRAQGKLNSIQGINNIYYAGAWTGYGFHEDGLASGVRVAELLGSKAPWSLP